MKTVTPHPAEIELLAQLLDVDFQYYPVTGKYNPTGANLFHVRIVAKTKDDISSVTTKIWNIQAEGFINYSFLFVSQDFKSVEFDFTVKD